MFRDRLISLQKLLEILFFMVIMRNDLSCNLLILLFNPVLFDIQTSGLELSKLESSHHCAMFF